ncbi:MAG: integrin alpha, partial [Halosimplex sp.]
MIGVVLLFLTSTVVAGAAGFGTNSGTPASAPTLSQPEPSGYDGSINLSTADVTYAGAAANDTAGRSVATAGDVNGDNVTDLIIGAPRNDTGGRNSGAAYIVYGPADPGTVDLSVADVTLRGVENNDLAGWSVSTAGDVNDDGYADVVVGAPYSDSAAPNGGAAYVVYGNESMPATMNLSEADAVLTGTERNQLAGYAVSNVNGSGDQSGVVVGAPYTDEGGENAGAAYVVSGLSLVESPTPSNLTNADTAYLGERNGSLAGWSVSTAGDVDDDGSEDVVIGAPRYNVTAAESPTGEAMNLTGAAYVADTAEFGTVSLANASLTLFGEGEGDGAGWSVSDAGDVNNDSVADVVVGAPYNDSYDRTDAGAAYVVYGGEAVDGETSLGDADLRVTGEGALDRAGWAVSDAGSGDVTCDAVGDVLVGAPFNDTAAGENAGAAYLVAGGDALAGERNLSDAQAKFVGANASDRAGLAVSSAGDVDDDGFEDVAIGAPYNDSANRTDAGAAYVQFSSCAVAPAPTPTPSATPTPTPTPTATPTPTPTATPTPTPTATPTPT